MAKKTAKKINEKKYKYKTKRNARRDIRKKYTSQKKSNTKNFYSTLSDFFVINKRKVLLPNELLEEARKILGTKISPPNFLKAIKIYDINNEINFKYLNSLKKITKKNYKYIYTLSFDNRQKIIIKHKIKRKIFEKSSKLIFRELVDFLINKFKQDEDSSKELMTYNLEGFGKFIIPIYEGTNELKYYYFISIILEWMKKINNKIVPKYLKFFKDFFKEIKNLDKIEYVFYALFRIDLLIFNPILAYELSLINANLMINENINHKIEGLKLIENKIKENIDKIKINNDTILTLKENNYKFKLSDYYFSSGLKDINPDIIVNLIITKKFMTYNYYINNRFNFCNNEIKANAFFNYFKKILSSQVMKEYFQNVKSFKDFEFPLTNKKIADYLLGKIICTVFIFGYWE